MGRLTLLFFKFFNHTNIETDVAWTKPNFEPMEYDAAPSRICVLGNPKDADGVYNGEKWHKYEIGNKITLETAKNMGLYESDYNSLIDDNWICYQLENNGIQITSTLSQSLETSFVYLFEPNGSSWLNDISDTTEYDWDKIRELIGGENGTVIDGTGSNIAVGSKHNNLIMRSLPAKPSDPRSFVANELWRAAGITRGLNRIIEHKIFAVADIIQEFLGDNNEKHHITPDEKTDMSLLKYYGPQIIVPSWREGNVTHSKKQIMAAEKVIISHDSITKYGLVNVVGTPVSAISIPFLYSADGADYLGESKSGYLPNGKGLCQIERILRISFDEGDTWVASDNTAMWPYVIDPCIINYTFNNTPKEKLIYQGKGIQIQGLAKAYATNPATKALFESGQPISLDPEIGEITLGAHIYLKHDNSIYNFSQSDSILLRAKNSANTQIESSDSIMGTPEIKILFNYAKRAEWFDTLNSYTADIVRNIQLENGVITGIKLNGTHLIKVENGQVVVETINQVN